MSNEAPKKIWMSEDTKFEVYADQYDGDILYIRADIVDGLVAALEGLTVHDFGANGWNDQTERYAIKARAALKALEETDGN